MQISEDLVEFIGILLGDGHLDNRKFEICLNGIDEDTYVKYVENFIYRIFGTVPKKRWINYEHSF
ncbi:MAG: hypothetical protein ACFFCI_12115 [Promethearchaeota archaeon]